ncbi:MAG TPA: DUF4124 domain-containing protein [Burkholderiales bacterium]|nr:DUF4124 domain-containing protein [Burkholderiales bacterium]
MKFLVFMSFFSAGLAHAESINRCTDANGKVAYSTTPCPAGVTATKTLEMKNSPSSPVENSIATDLKKQEAEFQRRRNNRVNQQLREEQQNARARRQEEDYRRRKEEASINSQRNKAMTRRNLEEDGLRAPTAMRAP